MSRSGSRRRETVWLREQSALKDPAPPHHGAAWGRDFVAKAQRLKLSEPAPVSRP